VRAHTHFSNDERRRFNLRCPHQPTHTHTKNGLTPQFNFGRPHQWYHTHETEGLLLLGQLLKIAYDNFIDPAKKVNSPVVKFFTHRADVAIVQIIRIVELCR
jgi:hypothetical protein